MHKTYPPVSIHNRMSIDFKQSAAVKACRGQKSLFHHMTQPTPKAQIKAQWEAGGEKADLYRTAGPPLRLCHGNSNAALGMKHWKGEGSRQAAGSPLLQYGRVSAEDCKVCSGHRRIASLLRHKPYQGSEVE